MRARAGYLAVFGLLLLPGALFLFPRGGDRALAVSPALVRYALAQASLGQSVYEERCSSCHGDRGEGSDVAPGIVGLGPGAYDFEMSTGRMPLDVPTEQPTRRHPVLSVREIREVTAYLVSVSPPGSGIPIPHVDPRAGSLSQGEDVYQSNCAACHGATGNGGAVGPRDAPNVHAATATQVAEAVRYGPTTMPVFDANTLTDVELSSLVRYVLYLRDPKDPGGASLNRIGPLIEGFFALVVGLGVLVVVTRYIGERS